MRSFRTLIVSFAATASAPAQHDLDVDPDSEKQGYNDIRAALAKTEGITPVCARQSRYAATAAASLVGSTRT